MKALLSLLFLAGVVCLGLNVWNWVWMSSGDRERLVRAILADEARGSKGVTLGGSPAHVYTLYTMCTHKLSIHPVPSDSGVMYQQPV